MHIKGKNEKKKQRIIHSIWIVESGRLKEIKPWGGGAYQREIASPRGERYYFLEDKKRALVIIVVRERERGNVEKLRISSTYMGLKSLNKMTLLIINHVNTSLMETAMKI